MMRTVFGSTRVLLVAAVVGLGQLAVAAPQVDYVPVKVDRSKVKDIGWDTQLSIGASTALAHNSGVVGQVDGGTFTLGAQLEGGLAYLMGVHEWRNTLKIAETINRTPVIDEFIKTTDLIKFDSIYLFRIPALPWVGPYLRFQLDMEAFASYDVRAEEVTYAIAGAPQQRGRKLRLSDPYKPLTLKETLGMYAKPYVKDFLAVEVKLGLSARETFADGQLAIDDDATTAGIIEVKPLATFVQGGPSAGLTLKGQLKEKRIAYYFDAETMLPVLNDSETKSAVDLLNVSLELGVSFKLFPWMSLDYQMRAIREPQLIDIFQVQNSVLLTFSYTLLESKIKLAKK